MNRDDFIEADFFDENAPKPVQIKEPRERRPIGDKIELVRFNGTAITTSGKEVKHNWFKGLELDQEKYSDILLTAEEAKRLHNATNQMKIGSAITGVLTCFGAALCPISFKCHPPGTRILTTNHGEIPIEDLDEDIHELVSFRRQSALILGTKNGYKFQKAAKIHKGFIVKIKTSSGKEHQCTPDHISIVKWSENALDKFCVYLMQRGDDFRIGKTKILRQEPGGLRFGPSARALSEKADKIWVLGVFETNTEALLAEEYYSCKFGIGKALFLATQQATCKWDGMYQWVTQEQLDNHHLSLRKTIEQIAASLLSLGLLYQCPIWTRDEIWDVPCNRRLGGTGLLEIRSCNIVSGYMDVQTYDKKVQTWERITTEKKAYHGIVWSLDVQKYHTYIANKIVTHNCPLIKIQQKIDESGEVRNVLPIMENCPVETDLLYDSVQKYAEEHDITDAPEHYTKQRIILELAECDVLENRMNAVLATKYQDLSEEKIVAVIQDQNGEREQRVKDVADAMKVKEKLWLRREKLRKNLVATPFDQYKRDAALQQSTHLDPASIQSELMARFKRLEALNDDE